MKYKIVLLNAILIIVLLLSSCGGQEEHVRIQDRELFGEIVIALDIANFTLRNYNQLPRPINEFKEQNNYRPINQKLIEFMELHPNVSIKIINTMWVTFHNNNNGEGEKWPGYLDDEVNRFDHAPNLSIMPDIIELTPHQVRFGASDLLQDLSFFIENIPPDTPWGKSYEDLIDLARIEGKAFLLPVRSDPMIVYYAAPIFKLLGIDLPTDEWTWEDYFQIARHLQDLGYVVGDLLRLPSIEHIVHAYGGAFNSPDYIDFSGYLDSEATMEALETYIHAISPVREPFMLSRWGTGNPLTSTWPALGMTRASSLFSIFNYLDGIDREYALSTMPLTANGERMNTTLLTGLALTNASNNKELAWELMKFIIGEGKEDEMDFVSNNTLIIQENRYVTRPPSVHGQLLRLIRSESSHSQVSSLSMFPTTVGGKPDSFYEPSWNIPEDVEINSYVSSLAKSLEEIRDTMIERGLGAP